MKNSNCDNTQKLKMWQIQIVIKQKKLNGAKLKNQIVTKLKKIKLLRNLIYEKSLWGEEKKL